MRGTTRRRSVRVLGCQGLHRRTAVVLVNQVPDAATTTYRTSGEGQYDIVDLMLAGSVRSRQRFSTCVALGP